MEKENIKYNPHLVEERWIKKWEEEGIYKFDSEDTQREIFSVDTPPPTVSGKMHLGHSFSYTQQDIIIRFQRMLGKNIFYPFGTDDNGLATERLIEKTKNIRAKDMSREDFVKLCLLTLEKELRPKYLADWKRIGMSCDWSIFYTTIDKHCQRLSQLSFIDLYKKGRVYRKDAPAMWCPECQTGISQQECKDKNLNSYFNDIIFKIRDEDIVIATTRPELLPACVAIFYHPTDKRYKKYKGKTAKVPLFNFEVPIIEDERAEPEKGTGIVMCCTFGDQTDMEWQKAYNLPIKIAITTDGKMSDIAGKYKGMNILEARKAIIEDLKKEKLLIRQEQITHVVNVHERCGTEIEFLKTKQWFIKYLDMKDEMLDWGSKLNWYPEHMKARYDNWIKGLQWDWLISRQRFFGVPFPLWYCKNCEAVIIADENSLPLDPLKNNPPIKECKDCGGKKFIPDTDVMDTWATSSLTPTIAVELVKGSKNYNRLFPMTLRPQAHDIITFWLFNTIVKSQLHYGVNPWRDVVISGFVLDPHRQKMSKSKGNVVEPQEVIKKYCADALRFWAAGVKLGDDLPYQEKDIITGMKTLTKLWNASRFVTINIENFTNITPKNILLMDRWILAELNKIIKICRESYMQYNYMRAKLEIEKFFWQTFCDNYLEICKGRLYGNNLEEKRSAQYALYNTLLNILKIFAPILPFITEEIFMNFFCKIENEKSIHLSKFPEEREDWDFDKELEIGREFVKVLEEIRKYKSLNKMSMKDEISRVVVTTKIDIKEAIEDLKNVSKVKEIIIKKGEFKVEISK